MADGVFLLRVKKLVGAGIIVAAAKHNRREIQCAAGASASIDCARSGLNQTLVGPASAVEVGQLARNLMAAAGLGRLRKDAVRALEIVFSLPTETHIDHQAYFSECLGWAGRYFNCPVLTADAHLDEGAKHLHLLMLPLVNGRMTGSSLVGGKSQIIAMQAQFFAEVASKFGLTKAPARLSATSRQEAARLVILELKKRGDSALSSPIWSTIRAGIEREPGPFVEALGIIVAPIKPVKKKTMAEIFTGKGKGPRVEKRSNPIGFDAVQAGVEAAPKHESLPCVGFAPEKTSQTIAAVCPDDVFNHEVEAVQLEADAVQLEVEVEVERVVERDDDHWASQFDGDTGQFYRPPAAPARLQRQAADGWVRAALGQVKLGRSSSLGA